MHTERADYELSRVLTVWRFSASNPMFSKTLKIELPYDPAMPLLDIYPKEWKSGSQRDVSTPMLIAALSTSATMWKQAKYPSHE